MTQPIVLCVDDEVETLSALRRCLRNEPYEVITARSAAEALGWIREVVVDLILTDQRMPGAPGTNLLREVRKRSPRTARAILTGYPQARLIQEGLEAGADTFLYKPWDDESLRATIRRILKKDATPLLESPPPFDLGGEGGYA